MKYADMKAIGLIQVGIEKILHIREGFVKVFIKNENCGKDFPTPHLQETSK